MSNFKKFFIFFSLFFVFYNNYSNAEIVKKGGRIVSSVSANLTYLIVGDSPGSKLAKVRQFQEQGRGITVLDEEAFKKLIFLL